MVEGAIFDMDGLMIDSERVWLNEWPATCEEFGVPFRPEVADVTRGTNNESGQEGVRQVYADYPDLDAAAVLEALDRRAHHVFWTQTVPAKPGLHKLLDFLRDRGVPCAVASSTSLDLIRHNLGNVGVLDYFQVIQSGHDPAIRHGKPAPDIFLAAARKLGVEPARSLVLEDSHNGVRAGAAGGFETVMVPDLSPVTDEMHQLATRICHDLGEVADLLAAGEL